MDNTYSNKPYIHFLKYWLPVIIWATIIFLFSSMSYEQQDLRPFISQFINEQSMESLFNDFHLNYAHTEVSVKRNGASGFIEFFIRKAGHLSEYALLALLLFRALYHRKNNFRCSFFISLLISIIYASSDEWHQSFTIHRTAKVEDVMLDSVGALLGILIISFYYRFRKKKTIAKNS